MKKVVLLLMLIPLVSFGQVKNGKVYTYHTPQVEAKVNEDGSVEVVKDTTLVLTSRNYIDGKKRGYEISYFRSGQIAHVVPMVDDLMQGQLLFFMDSKPSYVMRTENYEDGLKQGEQKFYYESGELRSTVYYIDGKRQGYHTSYFDLKDNPTSTFSKTSNSLKKVDVMINIISSTVDYVDGLAQGEAKYYNIFGKLIKTENYVDGVKQ